MASWFPTTAAYRALSNAGRHCSKNASQIEPWPLAYEMSPAWISSRPPKEEEEEEETPVSVGDSRSAATAAEVFLVAAKVHPGDCVEGLASPVPIAFFPPAKE